jgi:hypothetical protein
MISRSLSLHSLAIPLLVSQRLLNQEPALAPISDIAYRLHVYSP